MVTKQEAQPFLEALRAKQRDAGLSDTEMAQRLGISRPQYWRLLNDKRKVNLPLVQAAVRAYPDLLAQALSFFGAK